MCTLIVCLSGIFEGGGACDLLANWATGDTTHVIIIIRRCQHTRHFASSPTEFIYRGSSGRVVVAVVGMVSAVEVNVHGL